MRRVNWIRHKIVNRISNRIGLVLMMGIMGALLSGCGAKYNVDYDGQKVCYPGAKDSYRAGTKVKLIYDFIATDTDYSFWVDGADSKVSYDDRKGYIIEFTMPEQDVTVYCDSRNSMVAYPIDEPEQGLEIVELDGDGSVVEPVSPE